MSRIRLLLSFLCVAFAVAVALMKPLPSRAGNGVAPGMPPPTNAEPTGAQPTVKPKRRTTQLHLPFGKRVVDFAKHFVGTRYVYGGSSPRSGFDCSGLVRYVFMHSVGRVLPHNAAAQYYAVRHIRKRSLQPGDLVFTDNGYISHVGIFAGHHRWWVAPHTGTHVQLQRIYHAHFLYGRVLVWHKRHHSSRHHHRRHR